MRTLIGGEKWTLRGVVADTYGTLQCCNLVCAESLVNELPPGMKL